MILACFQLTATPVLPRARAALDSDDPWTFHHILMDIIPKLIDKGVTEKQINKLTKETPKKILG